MEDKKKFCIEYIDHMNSYRIYDIEWPHWTCAYEDSLEEAVKIVQEDLKADVLIVS